MSVVAAACIVAGMILGLIDRPLRRGALAFSGGGAALLLAGRAAGVRLENWRRLGPDTDRSVMLRVPVTTPRTATAARAPDAAAIVAAAVNDLPREAHPVLEHVAIVVSRRERSAHGQYVRIRGRAQDGFAHRLVVFWPAIVRDFGGDPEVLRSVVRALVTDATDLHLGRR